MAILNNDWTEHLAAEFEKPYYLALRAFLKEEYKSGTVYPNMYDIFNALHYTPYARTKVVILGQDPYHGPNQAHGLSFSVKPGIQPPPSLQNIFKELKTDLGFDIPNHGCLLPWAEQGVLLLNTVLTVRAGNPNSHKGQGWEIFTQRIIEVLNERPEPLVFILWGRHAQEKEAVISGQHHLIIKSPHPSPFSANRGFFGSRPFSRANQFLRQHGLGEVNWQLPPEADSIDIA
jgi:uracil-DNA glycosylase